MQIPSGHQDPFVKAVSDKAEQARGLFLEHVKGLAVKAPVKVMLGDGTVSDQESFDPTRVRKFFEGVLGRLGGWTSSGVSATTDQDLRRNFIKFEIVEDKYALSGHMSLQYHALLFYKLDYRIIGIQKELSEITDAIKQLEAQMAPEGDKAIEEKLRKAGYDSVDQQKLFEILFEHDDLTQELVETLGSSQKKMQELVERRDLLFKELDNMLIEVYHTTPVMIDEMKMIGAEEGCLCVFNLEYLRKDAREGNVNLSKISEKTKDALLKRMDEVVQSLKF
ncbi:MAG TPA: hypothetical protein VJ792_07610 [Candidatus Nitrosotalea sp.]|nr:hypothetical protein [Candidatus Nitrosotalea sp.]